MHRDITVLFWKVKTFAEMTQQEWESLCDRCGRCCLHKLEDPDSAEVVATNVACRLLDPHHCQCKAYQSRHEEVPECLNIRQENMPYHFLPKSCAYRRLKEGRDLASWHPLVSGDVESVHQAGMSVRAKTECETEIDEADLAWHIIDWIDV